MGRLSGTFKNALPTEPTKPSWYEKQLSMQGRAAILPMRRTDWPMRGDWEWALPGVAASAVNAVTAPGRAMRGGLGNVEEEGANFAGTFMGGGLLGSRLAPPPRGSIGMNAYHGSPHKFDAFDSTKIGSGEGAQAYGHGLYFAENPGVAKGYQVQNAYKAFDVGQEAQRRGINLNAGGRGEFIRQANANPNDPARAAKYLQYANADSRNIPTEKLTEMFSAYRESGGGAFYHVDIPDESIVKMLDWDKPLTQSQVGVFKEIGGPMTQSALNATAGKAGGNTYYAALAQDFGQAKASEMLNSAGIPGIRYLDAGSRAGGEGTRNFVLFDDKLAKITKME